MTLCHLYPSFHPFIPPPISLQNSWSRGIQLNSIINISACRSLARNLITPLHLANTAWRCHRLLTHKDIDKTLIVSTFPRTNRHIRLPAKASTGVAWLQLLKWRLLNECGCLSQRRSSSSNFKNPKTTLQQLGLYLAALTQKGRFMRHISKNAFTEKKRTNHKLNSTPRQTKNQKLH